MPDEQGRRHRSTTTPAGVRIHSVEEGPPDGPVVLLVHGFPESSWSWRHQLGPLAAAGYRAVAIDVRGYGRSSAPAAVEAYRMLAHVGDNLAVLDDLGVASATVVGHDWGAPIAAASALLRPDRFTSVALLSVPYTPPGGRRPTDVFAGMGGDEEFYISYFQEPGRAEAEIEPDVRGWLLGFYLGASGEGVATEGPGIATVPSGGRLRDRFTTGATPPAWMPEADLEVYLGEFERTGLSGGLNRYRNVDRDWEDMAPWAGAPITVPSLFIGGELDGPTVWGRSAIDRFPSTLPDCRGVHILPGCGHWVQQERPEEVTGLLLGWLGEVTPTAGPDL